ncbi:MAG TPA: ABC transporter ATP-binding protein [Vicinamibacterales bacterium]|nr:ABC transporter ATP-binding protein [Vicinamibacterales bacterium]
MSEIMIRAEGIGKRYAIRHERAPRYTALRDVITDKARAAARLGRSNGAPPVVEDFWALQDVSFDVRRGEVVGIIGRNGAGKSTLLKILSRITEPTSGRVELDGSVASLLEVGTGFHPELTGRENIFLNGAILGMSRVEIARKFDAIVAFAEVERFLDTPVKRYSSGMYVRLAFAVAAHLEPDILIVDEVLAVGDAVFQEKCLAAMKDVSRSRGRTVLFVSHNLGAIQSLCESAMVLSQGRVSFRGGVEEAVRTYLHKDSARAVVDDLSQCLRTGTGEARVLSVRLEDDEGRPASHFRMGEPLTVVVTARFQSPVQDPTFGVNVVTDTGILASDCRSSHYGLKFGRATGCVEYRMRIPAVGLYPRGYIVEPWIADTAGFAEIDFVRGAASFIVTSGPKFLSGANVTPHHGVAFIETSWRARVL